jgi:hypothetical protein
LRTAGFSVADCTDGLESIEADAACTADEGVVGRLAIEDPLLGEALELVVFAAPTETTTDPSARTMPGRNAC